MSYILSNIPFFVTLGVIFSVSCAVFMTHAVSRETKIDIARRVVFCLSLWGLTFIADIFSMHDVIFGSFTDFAGTQGAWWGIFAQVSSYIFALLALVGLTLCFVSLPYCGCGMAFLFWCFMTIPFKLFWFSMDMAPTAQNLFDLLTVKKETAADSILTALNAQAVLNAILPNVVVIAVMLMIFGRRKKNRVSIPAFIIGAMIFAAYCINPKGLPVVKGSAGQTMFIIRDFMRGFERYFIPREKITATTAVNPQNNIVFIVDESVRGDYVSVNNPGLGTTPALEKYLSEYPANIFNYGIMLASSTASATSRAYLLSGIDTIPDKGLQAFRNPTIFDVAKASGYRTILINVQGDFPDLFFRRSDMSRVDEVYLNEGEFDSQKNYEADFNAADFIRRRLKKEKGLFIFLEKMGVHVPYEKRYPGNDPKNQIFMPKLSDGEFYSQEKRRKVINSYKNALKYNLDGFFSRLFGDDPMSLEDCTIIYTSDHGQSFMENGQLYPHTTGELEQSFVPFVIFSTDSFTLENLIRPEEIPGTLSHLNIYPTIYSLLRRDMNHFSGEYNSVISRLESKNPPLIYFRKGALWDGEASDPAPADRNGKIILPAEKYMY